jgi:hypothetical protein
MPSFSDRRLAIVAPATAAADPCVIRCATSYDPAVAQPARIVTSIDMCLPGYVATASALQRRPMRRRRHSATGCLNGI